ncbi:prevent-host-death family protein [Microbacterium sp. W4I4]|uniref:type II toxin-antitoxin system Phd/YefM family antitoxin n=1 Tax=Microbacterium sp. W4I4 TaxID=3042295 RepID=UPI002780E432|nr:type II toxin-antitoxin system prevent-host-death family antitoxin [Microbacterium sp. W4I4]MDQ0615225.1 prevent-host-death family protein [Microbacterium sp. W4I4]
MTEVGIRALKQNASAVVAEVAAGETITVTDRGRPVARITPMDRSGLENLLETGLARPARLSILSLTAPEPGPPLSEDLLRARESERY